MSKVMEYLGVFCLAWKNHRRYSGETYFPTGEDKAAVKRFLQDVPGLPTTGEVARRVQVFLDDAYWQSAKHPAAKFFNQFNRYIPARVVRTPEGGSVSELGPLILCSACGKEHRAYEHCRETEQ